jgi:hypothetical protein
MKKLVVVFLCFFASNAFASSADSGRCPWKMPFTVTIDGFGDMHQYEQEEYSFRQPVQTIDDGTEASSVPITLQVDTSAIDTSNWPPQDYYSSIQYSLSGDVLTFSVGYWPKNFSYYPIYQFSTLTIEFAPGMDSIISLSYSEIDSFSTITPNSPINTSNGVKSFKIFGLVFNDTSIFTSDSSISDHTISMSTHYISGWNGGEYYFDLNYSDFAASSVTLSGIFRPTTFSDPPAIVTEASQPNNLAIYSSNGSIACSFDVSDHARDLEIYSPLGIREAISTIQPGQTEASLPHLPAGFYFVRMNGAMAKIYIADY